jgi:hypothetical protein
VEHSKEQRIIMEKGAGKGIPSWGKKVEKRDVKAKKEGFGAIDTWTPRA